MLDEINIRPAVVVDVGTSMGSIPIKECVEEETGKDDLVEIIRIDTDTSEPAPDIPLHKEKVKILLENPDAYGLEIGNDKLNEFRRELKNAPKGAMLNREIGRLHILAHWQSIEASLSGHIEGLKSVWGVNPYIIVIGSAVTGTGSAGIVDIPCLAKGMFPSSEVVVITTLTVCSSGTNIPLEHRETLIENGMTVVGEWKAFMKNEAPETFYPNYDNGKLKFGNVAIEATVPDKVFNVVPCVDDFQKLVEEIGLLTRDLIVYGIPYNLPGIENEVKGLDWRFNVVSVKNLPFDEVKVREAVVQRGFHRQVKKWLKRKNEEEIGVLAESDINKIIEYDVKPSNSKDDVLRRLKDKDRYKSFDADAEIKGFEEEAKSIKLDVNSVLTEISTRVEHLVRMGAIESAILSLKMTLDEVNRKLNNLRSGNYDSLDLSALRREINDLMGKLRETHEKRFVVGKWSKIERLAEEIANKLCNYEEVLLNRALRSMKLNALETIKGKILSLMATLNEVLENLNSTEDSEAVWGEHMDAPNMDKIIIEHFRPNVLISKLSVESLRSEWVKACGSKIDEVVRETFKPDIRRLLYFEYSGLQAPSDGEVSRYKECTIALSPGFAKVKGGDRVNRVIRRLGSDVTVYRFYLGVSLSEIRVGVMRI